MSDANFRWWVDSARRPQPIMSKEGARIDSVSLRWALLYADERIAQLEAEREGMVLVSTDLLEHLVNLARAHIRDYAIGGTDRRACIDAEAILAAARTQQPGESDDG